MTTNGERLAHEADRLGIPRRTLEQVKAALAETDEKDRRAFAKLMARHGRLTPDALEYVRGIA